MAQATVVTLLFRLAASLFLIVAVWPAVRGGTINATFLVLAMVFLILSFAVARRGRVQG